MTRPYRGYVSTPPNDEPAPCYPADRTLECNVCTRRRDGYPLHDGIRQFVVIDASTARRGPSCGMFSPVPIIRPFAELEHEVAA